MLLLSLFLGVDSTKRDQTVACLELEARGSGIQGVERLAVVSGFMEWTEL